MATNGASTLENIAKGKYLNVLNFCKILEGFLKINKEASEREGILKQIEKDKDFLDEICEKINESKGNSADILYSDNFSIKDALEGANISQEDAERFAGIINEYDMIEVSDNKRASEFSHKLMAMGVPHITFSVFKPVLDAEGNPITRKDGTLETTPVTILMTNHELLREIDHTKDYKELIKSAVRISKVNFNKEERFGYVNYKDFIKEVADVNNMSITVPEETFLLPEFANQMAFAGKKFTVDPHNDRNIIVPINDYAFAKAAIESSIYFARNTMMGNFIRIESRISKEKSANLSNTIDIIRKNKSNECIYIYNGSDTNNKSFIKVPPYGAAEFYSYRPNDKENPFVKEKNDIEYNQDSYKFVKSIFKEGQEITNGIKQGITFITGADIDAKASKEEQTKQMFEIIKQLDKQYDAKPAAVLDSNDVNLVYRMSIQQKYDDKINAILNLVNNKNYSAIKDNLNKLLVNQALIKILNAYDVNKLNVEKILEAVNNRSLAMGGQTFDLKSLIEENNITTLKEEEQAIKNAIINVCEEKEQQRANQMLIDIFDTSYKNEDEKILKDSENLSKKELENIISGTDLAIAIGVVNHRIEVSNIAKNLEEKSLNQTLDKIIEEKGLGMDSRDENEKEDPTR